MHVQVDVSDQMIDYDTLIYALGSGIDLDSGPGVRQFASSLDDPVAARQIAQHLRQSQESSVVVCGSGLTGIDTASEVACVSGMFRCNPVR